MRLAPLLTAAVLSVGLLPAGTAAAVGGPVPPPEAAVAPAAPTGPVEPVAPLSDDQVARGTELALAGLAADPRPRTRSTYDGAPTTKACYGTERASGRDGTPVDAVQYGAFYGCITPGEWLFALVTYDTFASSAVRSVEFRADADGNAGTGCGGFEVTVLGTWSTSSRALEAAVLSSPTCEAARWTYRGAADLQQPGSQDVGLLFRNADLGDPSTLRWVGGVQATGEAAVERLPATGTHVETGFRGASTSCDTAVRGTRFYTDADSAAAWSALTEAGATGLRRTRAGMTSFAGDPVRAQEALRSVDPTAAVRPEAGLELAAIPRDPDLPAQWNLEQVRAAEAWDVTRGSRSVVVAVVDTGADFTHPDLQGKLTAGYDAVRRVALTGGNTDRVGHGTAVAGAVAASTDDGVGLASLGWETLVMPIKVDDSRGQLVTSAVIDAIYYAADRGARVINLSLGGCRRDPALTNALRYAQSKGALPVAAAGNEALEGNPVEYPAADVGVVAVGATTRERARARYSNTGAYVDLVAPGGRGDGAPSEDLPLLRAGGGTIREAGSSFSAPQVAAAAALVVARDPGLRPAQVAERLAATAQDLGVTGRDDDHGAGLLDAAAAVAFTPGTLPAASTPEPTVAAPAAPSLRVSPAVIDPGTAVLVSGRTEPGAQVELLATSRPSITASVVRRAVTSSGQYSFRVTPGTTTRLQVRSTTAGGSATSAVATVSVRTTSSLAATRVGPRTYRFSGTLLPARAGVRVQVLRGSVLVATTTSTAGGRWSLDRRFTGTGTFDFTARVAATADNAAGRSPAVRVRVR